MRRRLSLAVAAASLIALTIAPAVRATPPVRESIPSDVELVLTDMCAFPVSVSMHQEWSGISRFDAQGNLLGMEFRITGRDTFSATHTLVGEPYTGHLSMMVDANGDPTKITGSGVIEKLRLPDGRLFVGAGWISYLDKAPDYVTLSPDRGSQVDLIAVCEALS